MSGNSWANMGQECIKCHINVYPHKQVGRRGFWWGGDKCGTEDKVRQPAVGGPGGGEGFLWVG